MFPHASVTFMFHIMVDITRKMYYKIHILYLVLSNQYRTYQLYILLWIYRYIMDLPGIYYGPTGYYIHTVTPQCDTIIDQSNKQCSFSDTPMSPRFRWMVQIIITYFKIDHCPVRYRGSLLCSVILSTTYG